MDANTFCERWFEIDKLTKEEKEKVKKVWGYRAKCVRLLSAVLKKPTNTVDKWGSQFKKMPKDMESTLFYADSIRLLIKTMPQDLLSLYLERNQI